MFAFPLAPCALAPLRPGSGTGSVGAGTGTPAPSMPAPRAPAPLYQLRALSPLVFSARARPRLARWRLARVALRLGLRGCGVRAAGAVPPGSPGPPPLDQPSTSHTQGGRAAACVTCEAARPKLLPSLD